MTCVTNDRLLLWGQVLGCIYVLLLGIGIALPLRLTACDLLFPLMMCLACLKVYLNRNEGKWKWRFEDRFLLIFLGWGLFSTVLHIVSGGAFFANMYEWCVFLYCALLLFFYRAFPLSKAQMLRLGTVILSAFLLCWLFDIVVSVFNKEASPLFWEVYGKMEESSMPFLARRYTFTFGNPNLAAPYCALGALLVAASIDSASKKLPYYLLLVANLLPIACTMSKHGILYLGVLLFLFARLAGKAIGEKWAKCLALAALALVICVFETTVLFVTFPLKGEYPFINTQPGMYNIHQSAYFRMLNGDDWEITEGIFKGWHHNTIRPLGRSVEMLHELYPQYVNVQSAAETLKYYNSEKDLGGFCTYMDPHCEYLNLATLFGVPAMLLVLFYLVYVPRRNLLGMLWIGGIMGSMLWDDVLSKRWIWIGIAIIVIINECKRSENETLQQGAPVGGN
ncbi:MAG: hypothetical protein IKS20_09530 [Victivallales bacterium]|nr:hypothetical protein [Victivallales bacterium]